MDRWPVDLFHVAFIAVFFTIIQQALKRGPSRQALCTIFQKASKGKLTDAEGLKLAKQAEARIVGALHISIQIPLAFYVLRQRELWPDKLHTHTPYSTLLAKISAGYFLHDLGFCVATKEGWPYTLHAACCSSVYIYAACFGVMHYYGAGFLMWELSTPFVYLRWFLHNLGYAKSPLYVANGFAMLISFFLARNVFGNYLTYQFLSDTTAAIAHPKAGGMSPTGLRASQIVDITLTILNTYWVGKMFQGGLKMLRKQNIDDPKYRSD